MRTVLASPETIYGESTTCLNSGVNLRQSTLAAHTHVHRKHLLPVLGQLPARRPTSGGLANHASGLSLRAWATHPHLGVPPSCCFEMPDLSLVRASPQRTIRSRTKNRKINNLARCLRLNVRIG